MGEVLCLMTLDAYFQMLTAMMKKITLTESIFIGDQEVFMSDGEFKSLLHGACKKYHEIHLECNFFRKNKRYFL